MRGSVFIRAKEGYGDEIKEKVIKLMKEYGMKIVDDSEKADLAIMIGGDGTLLKYQSTLKCPILGINPGQSVGYYMKANDKDFEKKIIKILEGKLGSDYFIFDLMRLETYVNDRQLKFLALNEVLISSIYTRRILKAELEVNGKMSIEHCSGIIIYTPTGSNAFAHSAGAKKILYNENIFGIVGLAPYIGVLKKGPILTQKDVIVIPISELAEICIDGQENQVKIVNSGDTIVVKKSANPVSIIGFSREFE